MFDAFLGNTIVLNNIAMFICVIVSFCLSLMFNKSYNDKGKKVSLVLSRILIVLALVSVIIWFFK